jgi:hypothetical protein
MCGWSCLPSAVVSPAPVRSHTVAAAHALYPLTQRDPVLPVHKKHERPFTQIKTTVYSIIQQAPNELVEGQ